MLVISIDRSFVHEALKLSYTEGHAIEVDGILVDGQRYAVMTSGLPGDVLGCDQASTAIVSLFGEGQLLKGTSTIMSIDSSLYLDPFAEGKALTTSWLAVDETNYAGWAITGLVRYALGRHLGNREDGIAYMVPEPAVPFTMDDEKRRPRQPTEGQDHGAGHVRPGNQGRRGGDRRDAITD